MIISWFRFEVAEKDRERFTRGQACWGGMVKVGGFLGRLGGWDAEGHACVFTMWRDDVALRMFRRNQSEKYLDQTGLRRWYAGRMPDLIEVLLPIPGLCTTTTSLIGRARVMRLVTAKSDPKKEHLVLDEQRRVWKPALSQARGMLGGYFGSVFDEPGSYFGASCWTTTADHERWVREGFPRCVERAERIELAPRDGGHRVLLELDWTVQRPGVAERRAAL